MYVQESAVEHGALSAFKYPYPCPFNNLPYLSPFSTLTHSHLHIWQPKPNHVMGKSGVAD